MRLPPWRRASLRQGRRVIPISSFVSLVAVGLGPRFLQALSMGHFGLKPGAAIGVGPSPRGSVKNFASYQAAACEMAAPGERRFLLRSNRPAPNNRPPTPRTAGKPTPIGGAGEGSYPLPQSVVPLFDAHTLPGMCVVVSVSTSRNCEDTWPEDPIAGEKVNSTVPFDSSATDVGSPADPVPSSVL